MNFYRFNILPVARQCPGNGERVSVLVYPERGRVEIIGAQQDDGRHQVVLQCQAVPVSERNHAAVEASFTLVLAEEWKLEWQGVDTGRRRFAGVLCKLKRQRCDLIAAVRLCLKAQCL